MFELFENLTNWLWGLPLLITILATGVYLTVRSGFFQFRHFGYIVKNMFSKERRQEGGDDGKSLTPFQAISIAIGGTVGVSNMSGVATAIATGGPGALFWLWIAALLAMVIKMAEVTLAVYYREKQPNGKGCDRTFRDRCQIDRGTDDDKNGREDASSDRRRRGTSGRQLF